jgi:hypothetical protein
MSFSRLSQEDYLSDRVDQQLEWLSSAAARNKSSYQTLRLIQIVLAVFVTVGGSYSTSTSWMPIALAISGALISLGASVESLNGYHDQWLRYRQTTERLRREKLFFLTGSGPYREIRDTTENEACFLLFVSRVEALLGEEVDQWSETAATEPSSSGSSD